MVKKHYYTWQDVERMCVSIVNQMYADHTGQPLKVIDEAMERDKFMSTEEALEFGLLDKIIKHRADVK